MTLSEITHHIRKTQEKHRQHREMVKGVHVPYYRRGEMAVPAFKMKSGGNPETDGRETSLKLMKKVCELPVDFFFYDLEDASPDHPEYKAFARKFVAEVLNTADFGNRVVAFRPNNIRTEYFEKDIVEVVSQAGDKLDAIVLPKTEHAEEVRDVITIVNSIQKASGHSNTISFEVLIESPRAFLEAEQIASIDQVTTLIFGAWDFARTTGAMVEADTWTHDQLFARQSLPIIAAAYGKDAVDAVTGTLPIRPTKPEGMSPEKYNSMLMQNPATFNNNGYGDGFLKQMTRRYEALLLAESDALNARRCGYAAKWILHPDQIEPIQRAWTPTRDRAIQALNLAVAYTKAARNGSGAEVDGNRLADKAVVGTDWWIVIAGLRGNTITDQDIAASGFTLKELELTVVTHD